MATQGLGDILRGFKGLERAAQLRVLRSGANAALKPIQDELRRVAPRGDEPHKTYKGRWVAPKYLSRKGIRKSSRINKAKGTASAQVYVGGEAWYGSLLEHGFRGKGPRAWFNPVIKRMGDDVFEDYQRKVAERIIAEFHK